MRVCSGKGYKADGDRIMTTYTATTSGQIDAESPIDVTLAGQWTNNLLAIQEGDDTAPALATKTGASMPLLEAPTDASNDSSIDFTGLTDGYPFYMFIFDSVLPATDNVGMQLQISQSASFLTSSYNYFHNNRELASSPASDVSGANATTIINMMNIATSYIGNASAEGIAGRLIFHNPDNSKYAKVEWVVQYTNGSGTGWTGWGAGMNYSSPGTGYDGLRFKFSTGNVSSGRFRKYGLKESW